eukprot:gnl/TRDRNA2_/TRDRNA2_134952_c0_seq2.p1 gnl/TRDRNA2_/TRDRNA2_134952_c0~~gnl/TRDRNA2_/TRDRNA2_134952_c0_seq2.p1  ORF type:complete len:177 (-),score=29.26 gnl/TRDRNA2_/TRDRNA2_134952_c0_seq2:63-593(-)
MTEERRPLVYLASPLGFSSSLRDHVLPHFVAALEAVGAEVYEPFARNKQAGLIKKEERTWAWDVANADHQAVRTCDAIFAIINGLPPDEGVCVELGIAIALGKPTFLFRDDFRNAGDSEAFPCNLMLMAGLPRDETERSRFLYTSIADIANKDKALWQWMQSEGALGARQNKLYLI